MGVAFVFCFFEWFKNAGVVGGFNPVGGGVCVARMNPGLHPGLLCFNRIRGWGFFENHFLYTMTSVRLKDIR